MEIQMARLEDIPEMIRLLPWKRIICWVTVFAR